MLQNKLKIISKILLSVFIFLLTFFLIFYFWWFKNLKDNLAPNTFLATTNISSYKEEDIKKLIENNEFNFKQQGIGFIYQNKIEVLPLITSGLNPDIPDPNLLYIDSIKIDLKKTIDSIFQQNNFLSYLQAKFFNKKTQHYYYYYYNLANIQEWILNHFPDLLINPESAYFSLTLENGNKKVVINQEKIGRELNLVDLDNNLTKILNNLTSKEIILKTKSVHPRVKQIDLLKLQDQVLNLVPENGLNLLFFELNQLTKERVVSTLNSKDLFLDELEQDLLIIKNNEINIPQTTLINWLSINNNFELLFNEEKINLYLTEKVGPLVNREVVLPKFEIINNKVSNWQVGIDGRNLDVATTVVQIQSALINKNPSVEIILNIIDVNDLDVENNFKIKELIGTGHSNFAGSPSNRIHNIKIGAESLNGLLIEPGEEFSLVKYLGNISAATGYLPELTIKGGKTIPEYGGGLCQVATTIFRSALGTGLPITARRNHSYRVSYYEPAGMDAAVYNPWPDVKFINDTNNYILIQSRIEGNNIYFDFWGTSDGRTATTTKPVIFNIIKPQPTKFIETNELKPGEIKCTESAHNGADAYFDYIVNYPEGSTTTPRQETRFNSHYVPWQEVCLIGKEPSQYLEDDLENNLLETIIDKEEEKKNIFESDFESN